MKSQNACAYHAHRRWGTSTSRTFLRRCPNPKGESLTADPLLRGKLAQFALRWGSTYTLIKSDLWACTVNSWEVSFDWSVSLGEGLAFRVMVVTGRSMYLTTVTTWTGWLDYQNMVSRVFYPQLNSFGPYEGGCTCHAQSFWNKALNFQTMILFLAIWMLNKIIVINGYHN